MSGIPITQLLDRKTLDAIVDRTRNGGAEIVKHLKTGSAYYAPSSGAVQMAEAIVNDQKRILPCAAWLEGEYGMSGLFLGVPCKLGRGGLEKMIEVELTPTERVDAREERRGGARADGEAFHLTGELLDPMLRAGERRLRHMTAPTAAAASEPSARTSTVARFWHSSIGKKASWR